MRYIRGTPDGAHTKALSRVTHDYSHVKPASDVAFEAYRSHYLLDRKDLNPVLESAQGNPGWKQLRIVIAAAYGSEKLPLYIVLPKSGKPPYQVVVYHPGQEARIRGASSAVVPFPVDYIVRAGRAVVLPVLSDTYERFNGRRPQSPIEVRDESVRRFQDIVRTLEYLETPSDIDKQRIAYLGHSWGAAFGPIVLALEPRFKAGVLQSGRTRRVRLQ
jgi:dienelactone hydrolase